jgi:acylpyruvate hydrolase
MLNSNIERSMIIRTSSLIAYVSTIMKLEAGDVLLTGTPSGVGPIRPGDIVTAGLKPFGAEKDLVNLKFNVIERKGNYID